MEAKKMFKDEVLGDLLDRIHTELDNSGQFDLLEQVRDFICIRTEDKRVYVRIELQRTYSNRGTSARANGLRIRFKSSLFNSQLRTYTVPKWDPNKEEWTFSRSKLLAKAAAAVESICTWQEKNDNETLQRQVFTSFIAKTFGHLTERGDVRLVHDYNSKGRSIRRIVRIELPKVHMDLYSPDRGQTFQIERIQPMDDKNTPTSFDVEAIKKIVTKLEELLIPEEELVLQQ